MTRNTASHELNTQLTGLRLRIGRTVWIALAFLALTLFVAGISPRYDELRVACAGDECPVLALSSREIAALNEVRLSPEFYAAYQVGIEIIYAIVFTLLAGVIFWRRSDDWMGMLVSLTLIAVGTILTAEADAALVKLYPNLGLLVAFLTSLEIVFFVLLFYLFPDGRFVPRWTRLLAIVIVVVALYDLLFPSSQIRAGLGSIVTITLFIICLVVGLLAQVYRYRRVSGPTQRQQTKWIVFSLFIVVLGMIVWLYTIEIFPPSPGPARLYLNLFGVGVIFVSFLPFPLSFTIAIMRYRLWDIDLVIRRTLVYASLTGLLALVYFGSVVGLQSLVNALGGQQSAIVTVISTLAIAALFTPVRRRVQDFIDQRFFRAKYDAEQTLAAFAATARDEVDMERLAGALLSVVEETMQPTTANLWLQPMDTPRRDFQK